MAPNFVMKKFNIMFSMYFDNKQLYNGVIFLSVSSPNTFNCQYFLIEKLFSLSNKKCLKLQRDNKN